MRIPRYADCVCGHRGWQHRGSVCVACDCPGFERPRYRLPLPRGLARPVAGRKVAGHPQLRDDR